MKVFKKVNQFFTKRIQRQFLFPFLFLILLTGFVVAGTSYWFSLNNTTSAMTKNVERQMDYISESFNTLFRTISHNVNRYSENDQLANQEEFQGSILAQFEQTKESLPYILNIYMGDSSTKEMLIYPSVDLPSDYDPTTRPWYENSIEKQGKVIWTEPYVDAATGDTIVSAAKAIEDGGQVKGVFSIDFTVNTLFELVKDVQVGKTGDSILISDTGVYLVHPNEDLIGKSAENAPYYSGISSGKSGTYEYRQDGETKVASFATNPETGWKVIGVVNVSDFASEANQIIVPILVVLLVVILLSLLIAFILTRQLTRPIKHLQQLMKQAGNGDFSINAKMDRDDEIGELSNDFQQMIDSIHSLIHKVKTSSSKVSESAENVVANSEENTAASQEISRAIQDIANGAQNQTVLVDQSVQSSNILAETINGVVTQSEHIKAKSDHLMDRSEEAKKIVRELREHSTKTNKMTSDMKESIEDLQSSSENINQVVSTISGIAAQTNLLALNAAIEAARAGEAGKGFAVVADEVRKLAEQSESALTDVSGMIDQMQSRTYHIVQLIEDSGDVVKEQEKSVNDTEKSFENVFTHISENVSAVNQIINSMKDMTSNKDRLLQNIDEISTVAEDTAAASEEVSASIEESNAAMEQLNHLAEELEEVASNMEEELQHFHFSKEENLEEIENIDIDEPEIGQKAG